MTEKNIVRTLRGEKTGNIPIWLMRQAGRYLPEYLEVRAKAGDFLSLCYNPKLASEVTLQPITRFGFDAAIIFSDILVIPHALGLDVSFLKNHGPKIEKISTDEDLKKLSIEKLTDFLKPVYEAISITKSKLGTQTALIGFAGAPWTLACYMVEGEGSKNFDTTRRLAYQNENLFSTLIDLLTQSVALHLINQIEAGAEIVQIFDSWALVLPEEQFHKWVIQPTKKIVQLVKEKYPDIPIIGFPRGASFYYLDYAKICQVDGISLDTSMSLAFAKDNLKGKFVLQGNLDPLALQADKNIIKQKVDYILNYLADQPFIFNLGHGILPETKTSNVEYLVKLVREFKV